VLRRFAELEPNPAQRSRVVAWVDHLAFMLEHPSASGER